MGVVTLREKVYWLDDSVTGFKIARPPRRDGKVIRID